MPVILGLFFLTGAYPLGLAWWANRRTSLLQAINWAVTAWLAWIITVVVTAGQGTGGGDSARYLALCLTGCAGVAVLGARRPHVAVWNFVVLGLLAVMVLPLLEQWLAGVPVPGPVRIAFLVAILAVGMVNYLPTRLAAAAVLLALGCTGQILQLWAPGPASWFGDEFLSGLCLALSPWAAYLGWRWQPPPAHALDGLWLDFRNRYGLVWAQRVREQFNRAAVNAGWPVYLSWQGLRRLVISGPDTVQGAEILAALQALLQRFGPEEPTP